MLPFPAPKKPPVHGDSEWKIHWLKIAKENPQLKTNRARQKKACEEWLKKEKNYYVI
jgi:hypothetical protein